MSQEKAAALEAAASQAMAELESARQLAMHEKAVALEQASTELMSAVARDGATILHLRLIRLWSVGCSEAMSQFVRNVLRDREMEAGEMGQRGDETHYVLSATTRPQPRLIRSFAKAPWIDRSPVSVGLSRLADCHSAGLDVPVRIVGSSPGGRHLVVSRRGARPSAWAPVRLHVDVGVGHHSPHPPEVQW